MKLDKYISETVYSISKAISDADKKLREEKIGRICEAFNTHSKDLISAHLVKGKDPENDKKSIPVLLLEFDVNIAVIDEKGEADEEKIGVGAKFLQVFNFGGEVKGKSSKTHSEKEIQNLKFTIPVSINMKKQ